MKLLIDSLDSITDWVVNAPSAIETIDFSDSISGLNDSSLLIKFDISDSVKTAVKTFSTPYDVSDYENLVFSIWSQQYKNTADGYFKSDDFVYKIKLNSTQEFYVPVWGSFTDITIGIEDVDSIDRIEITALHDVTDYIIISEMIAEKEEIPLDILKAVKEHIDYYMNIAVSDGILLGTVSATAGDETMSLSYPDYLDKYSVIKIDDGVNSETHQIDENDGEVWNFNSNYDGNSFVNDFTDANVYLTFPSYINPMETEIKLPGIAIWGIEPDPIIRGSKLDTEIDTFSVDQDNFKGRVEGEIFQYPIYLDAEARQQKLIDIMTRVIRKFIGGESVWINGRRHDISFAGPPTELRPTEGIDIIPKVQYPLIVEIKESLNDRTVYPKTTTINITVTGGTNG